MFINGLGAISPLKTADREFPSDPVPGHNNPLTCLEPDYKQFISPRRSRRMSRIVKMGVASALMALDGNTESKPDAVIVGSGYGCLKDTERFLGALISNRETFLNPAPFIHSTHNTIGSQVALIMRCTGYNQTYVHGPFSFETALLDGLMLMKEGEFSSILVGGVDEMTANLFHITRRVGLWKTTPCSDQNLLTSTSKGTIAGEGAHFFRLQQELSASSLARVVDVATWFGLKGERDVTDRIKGFLDGNRLDTGDLDLCFLGKNGDKRTDRLYTSLQTGIFKDRPVAAYKHLCGEYPTASAFALWLATTILKYQQVPGFVMISDQRPATIDSILIVNRYQADYLSLVLLQTG